MFSGCSSLTSIDLTFLNLNGNNYLASMFFNCSKLETIKLNANLYFKNIDDNGVAILTNADLDHPWEFVHLLGNFGLFTNCNFLKNIDLFNSNTSYNYSNELINDLTDLEGCLFNKFDKNIKKCSKYMGFHYCGECKNINKDEYCLKEIEGNDYTFYNLFEQFNLLYNERNCFWSDNYNNFYNYTFVKNTGNGISFYQKNFFEKKCYISRLKECYYLCKDYIQITDSLFYQQCKECDEKDYTLDLYSDQKSLCIPKDKSGSSFIKDQTKWYIEDFEGIENLTIINKNLTIDYESL